MPIKFFSFNLLAAYVASAVSESKKAVSAVAAAIVGFGLLSGYLSLHAEDEVGTVQGGNNPPFECLRADG